MSKLAAAIGCALALALSTGVAAAEKPVATVAAVAGKAKVRAAMEAIRAGEAQDLKDLVTLTEIPAPPFGEGPRGARFAEMIRAAGIADVTIDEVGNVIARRPGRGGGPTVAIIAHLDTVFPEGTDVRVRVEGDTFRAPGIGDNTRGLVYLLALARAMEAARVRTRGDILFVANVGEEGLGDLRGVRHLFRAGGPKIDAALVVDGGGITRVVNAGVGSTRYKLVVKGPGGHSYGAFGLANPHHALARILARFDEAALPVTKAGPRATYNVGRIGGGTSVNAIPFESWAEIDMRSPDPAKLAELEAALNAAVTAGLREENEGRAGGDAATAALEPIGSRPAGTIPDNAMEKVVTAAMAHLRVGAPQLGASSTDANIPLSLGIPAVTVGAGGESGRAHALDEYWRNTPDAYRAGQTGLLTVFAWVGAE